MYYPLNPQMLELLLLSVISKEDTYGYQVGQDLRVISDLKDSTLYPILKKLSDQGFVEIYDKQINGRNRKYYHITLDGIKHLEMLTGEWLLFSETISSLLKENEEAVKNGGTSDSEGSHE